MFLKILLVTFGGKEGAHAMGIDEYYELLQLGITLLGIVTIILAFVFVGYEKSGSQ